MLYIILFSIAVICAVGWIIQYVVNLAIIHWLMKKEIPLPRDELQDDISYAWKKVFRIK